MLDMLESMSQLGQYNQFLDIFKCLPVNFIFKNVKQLLEDVNDLIAYGTADQIQTDELLDIEFRLAIIAGDLDITIRGLSSGMVQNKDVIEAIVESFPNVEDQLILMKAFERTGKRELMKSFASFNAIKVEAAKKYIHDGCHGPFMSEAKATMIQMLFRYFPEIKPSIFNYKCLFQSAKDSRKFLFRELNQLLDVRNNVMDLEAQSRAEEIYLESLRRNLRSVVDGENPWDAYRLAGQTEEDSFLGKGSFGRVYKVKEKSTGLIFALKEIDLSYRTNISQVIGEVRMIHNLKEHPNIVKQHGVYLGHRKLWIVYEYMAGGSLKSLIQIKSRMAKIVGGEDSRMVMPEQEFATICRQIMRGIAHLHANGIMHRDIKSYNILWNPKGEIKLADFGLVTMCFQGTKVPISQAGAGTFLWKAPEIMIPGSRSYDEKVDIWAAGIVFAELLREGRPPRSDQKKYPLWDDVIEKVAEKGQPRLKALDVYSPEMQDFVRACLTIDPEARPSASELLQHPFLAA